MVWRCWSRIGEWDVARLGSRVKRGIKRLRGYDGVQVDHFASEPSEPPGPSDTPREDMLSYLRNRKEATPEAPLSLPLPPSCIARLFRYTAVLPGLKGNDRQPQLFLNPTAPRPQASRPLHSITHQNRSAVLGYRQKSGPVA